MTGKPCRGGGKSWTVDMSGRPICPRCRRTISTVAGKGRTPQNTPMVPAHDRLSDKLPKPSDRQPKNPRRS
ncbi:MAG: hypothetical protein ACSLFA_20690 [Mycobacterium sp.]